jgi:hypothetical protein
VEKLGERDGMIVGLKAQIQDLSDSTSRYWSPERTCEVDTSAEYIFLKKGCHCACGEWDADERDAGRFGAGQCEFETGEKAQATRHPVAKAAKKS